jgi:Glycosyltransferase family 87
MPRSQHSKFVWDVLLAILLVSAGTEFVLRGPVRFVHAASFNDFISPYIQTRAWMRGEDPYSAQNLVRLWPPDADRFDFLARDLADGTLVLKRGIPTAYPLSAFVLIAPVAMLPWKIAQPMWLVITVLSFIMTVAALLSFAKTFAWTRRTVVFLAIALALAPFHTALAAGSIVVASVAASAGAVWAASRQHDNFAGVLLAVATGLKPQIGLPFLFYYFVTHRWRISGVAIGSVAILFGVALARCAASHTPWLESYLYDNRILFATGSLGDFTEGNPIRFGLINFQVAAYAVLHNRAVANLTAILIAGLAGLLWLSQIRKYHGPGLLALSALVVLSLLPVYHRFYDATLLIFPLAWCIAELRGLLRMTARTVFVVICFVFLIPGGSALQQMEQAGHFIAYKNSWWWNTLVLPHESWAVLLIGVLLLNAMYTTSGMMVPDRLAQHLS